MKVPLTTQMAFLLHRHGWPAAVGLVFMALVWPIAHFGADSTRAETRALQAAQLAERERRDRQPDPQLDQATQLATFEGGLPQAAGALQAVRHIHRSASEHGVALSTGEYRLVDEPGGRLQRYQITLPADGTYPDLRAWMADVLNELPTMALDELSFKRNTVGESKVQARVRWSFYLKAP
ncbi:GspMb/PilO family protein [Hydrogenophaga sp. Root209]|uniref:GspMb/PilO family protein n=1 Tax=Hydrogenophaga sp. Root209 TaxID=1736490 RepID=UPI000ADB470D|nr:GspMb/PilO family protein [Hydrogenophaga sp. Root209]